MGRGGGEARRNRGALSSLLRPGKASGYGFPHPFYTPIPLPTPLEGILRWYTWPLSIVMDAIMVNRGNNLDTDRGRLLYEDRGKSGINYRTRHFGTVYFLFIIAFCTFMVILFLLRAESFLEDRPLAFFGFVIGSMIMLIVMSSIVLLKALYSTHFKLYENGITIPWGPAEFFLRGKDAYIPFKDISHIEKPEGGYHIIHMKSGKRYTFFGHFMDDIDKACEMIEPRLKR